MDEIMEEHEQITPKELIESDDEVDINMPTTVTIVEEDGSTSIVEDASVSSISTTDAESHSSLQFAQSQGVTYRVVGIANDGTSYSQPTSGVQVISPSLCNGQYYVIGSQEVLGRQMGGRGAQIIEARSIGRSGGKASVRDEKKRATHNEVERRRRDKINGWINKLAKIVPACNEDNLLKQGQVHQNSSKGGILAKACEYITELRTTNCRLASTLKEHENTAEELDTLRREISELKRENMMLKQQIGPTEEDSTIIISTTE